jgi:hypothetical protein
MMVIGNFSLVAAIVFWQFVRPAHGPWREWVDGLSGLLFGISIGVNLFALRRARRCGATREPHVP